MTTDSTKKACVFCNGQLKNPANVKQIANDCDLLIAADGGAKYFSDIELTPQVIVGDMDSIDSDIWKSQSGIEHIRYPVAKDKSDAELAVVACSPKIVPLLIRGYPVKFVNIFNERIP